MRGRSRQPGLQSPQQPLPGRLSAPPAVPTPVPPLAVEDDAPLPRGKPAVKEAAEPTPDAARGPNGRPSRAGGLQPQGEAILPPFGGKEPPPRFKTARFPSRPGAPRRFDRPSVDTPKKKAEKLRFQFRFQPWKDVLDWFAQQADLSLVIPETIPPGTFNYSDTKDYTPAEAIDLLNSVLLTKNYYLVRHDRMLMLVNLDDGIPKNLVTTVPVESLDSKGESELVNVQFALNKIRPEDVEAEVRKLLGPQGSVESLAKSQQLSVTDTAGRLRAVRNYLKNTPEGTLLSGLKIFQLKYAQPEEVLPIVRQLLEIPEDKNLAVDGSIRIAQESGTDRLLVSGRPDKVARATEIIAGLDKPPTGGEASRLSGTPQLEIYSLNGADGTSALAVLQTVLAGQLDVHLSVDPKAGTLVALAHPAQHATIKAVLKQYAWRRGTTEGGSHPADPPRPAKRDRRHQPLLHFRRPEASVVHGTANPGRFGESPADHPRDGNPDRANPRPADQDGRAARFQRSSQPGRPHSHPADERRSGPGRLAAGAGCLADDAAEPDSDHRPGGRKRFQQGAGRRGRIAQSAPRVETFRSNRGEPHRCSDLRPRIRRDRRRRGCRKPREPNRFPR